MIRLFGGRIFKTGISVFITAFLCQLFTWPPTFAVITALVTIEPTAKESIRKAPARFQASSIAASFAVLFTFIFSDSSLAYALTAVFTLMICTKLKLEDGLLVAALTGMAMISIVQEAYMATLLMRLGGTTLGLLISTCVNIFILPPNYLLKISKTSSQLMHRMDSILIYVTNNFKQENRSRNEIKQIIEKIEEEVAHCEQLIQYQKDEWRFHKFSRKDVSYLRHKQKHINILKQAFNHLCQLATLSFKELTPSPYLMRLLEDTQFHLKQPLKQHNENDYINLRTQSKLNDNHLKIEENMLAIQQLMVQYQINEEKLEKMDESTMKVENTRT
ncbi:MULTISPECIES: aromatic acid exporter family protein [Cytobacillus]|uniref:Aromatic acid exporter family protein n=1 Tax=Cytobacillus stercorigallinarum TaxID=2762240 RepID=A0ABR8QL91_9BACI|nr:aromatic acid exporter family protein [Cytobacillus stercorigallinarum]MBD7936287.1 aromatic acid exporter family protein [Cytobacillus stercorigallinarum]